MAKKILVLGGAHIDRRGRIFGETAPGASNPGAWFEEPGGGGFNAARNLSRLGFDVRLISPRGGDPSGEMVAEAASQAGIATGVNGILAVMTAPFIPKLMQKFDARILVFFGLSWLAGMSVLRSFWTTDTDFFHIMLPQLIQGLGMTAFFVPITVISLGSVEPRETASAAGILSFARSLAAAVGTSIYTTVWGGRQGHMPTWEVRLSSIDRKILALYVADLRMPDHK